MKEKKRYPFSTVLTLALMMALGFGAGWLGAWMADHADLAGWQLLALLAAAAVGVLVQIVLHEGGHLAAGLATGYGFVSFRIGSIMLLKKGSEGKKTSWKDYLNPGLIACIAAFFIYWFQIELPEEIETLAGYYGNACTLLSMIVIGISLAGMRELL